MRITKLSHPKVWEFDAHLRNSPVLEVDIADDDYTKYLLQAQKHCRELDERTKQAIACYIAISHPGFHAEATGEEHIMKRLNGKLSKSDIPIQIFTQPSKIHMYLNFAIIALLLLLMLLLVARPSKAEPVEHEQIIASLKLGPRIFAQTVVNASIFKFDASRNLYVNCAVGCGGGGGPTSTNLTQYNSIAVGPANPLDVRFTNTTIGVTQGTSPWVVSANGGSFAVTGTFFQATQPVSIAGTVAVSGPLTDAQLRATPVPVSGAISFTTPQHVITDATSVTIASQGTSPWTVAGTKSNNNATPNADNLGALTAIPTVGDPIYTANFLSFLSTDLTGHLRTINTQGTSPWLVSGTGSFTVQQPTGTNLHVVVDSGSTTSASGTLTNNNAAPSNNNMGVLPCLANAANPSWTEGDQVLCSVTLAGNERVIVNAPLPAGTNVIGHVITDTGSTTAVTGTVAVTGPLTDTQLRASPVPVSGTVQVSQATASNLNAQVVGNIASGSADSGNPIKIGCVNNISSSPSLLTPLSLGVGQRADCQVDQYGRMLVYDAGTPLILGALQDVKKAAALQRITGSFNQPIGSIQDALKVIAIQLDPCTGVKNNFAISQTANTLLVLGIGHRVFVCSVFVIGADAENISFVGGTGATCGTGTTGVIGGATAATGPNMAANGGFTLGNGGGTIASTNKPGDDLCLFISGSGRVAGNITVAYGQ